MRTKDKIGDFELNHCEKCIQMTNWENGECAKCKINKIISENF